MIIFYYLNNKNGLFIDDVRYVLLLIERCKFYMNNEVLGRNIKTMRECSRSVHAN